jgi:transposase, IS5 family
METYVRPMVVKHRPVRLGDARREVSDSLDLRRFCRIPLAERVPDASTLRKLTPGLGAETVTGLTPALIVKARRERRFRARAVRIDSTGIEADAKYPTDAGLAARGCARSQATGANWPARLGESG